MVVGSCVVGFSVGCSVVGSIVVGSCVVGFSVGCLVVGSIVVGSCVVGSSVVGFSVGCSVVGIFVVGSALVFASCVVDAGMAVDNINRSKVTIFVGNTKAPVYHISLLFKQ